MGNHLHFFFFFFRPFFFFFKRLFGGKKKKKKNIQINGTGCTKPFKLNFPFTAIEIRKQEWNTRKYVYEKKKKKKKKKKKIP